MHKAYTKVDFEHTKSQTAFLGQSLPLSTTILNDGLQNNSLIALIPLILHFFFLF